MTGLPACPGARSELTSESRHRRAPGWLTLWLILIITVLVALGVAAGPWARGAITAIAGLTAGRAAMAKRFVDKPADPALVYRSAAVVFLEKLNGAGVRLLLDLAAPWRSPGVRRTVAGYPRMISQ